MSEIVSMKTFYQQSSGPLYFVLGPFRQELPVVVVVNLVNLTGSLGYHTGNVGVLDGQDEPSADAGSFAVSRKVIDPDSSFSFLSDHTTFAENVIHIPRRVRGSWIIVEIGIPMTFTTSGQIAVG